MLVETIELIGSHCRFGRTEAKLFQFMCSTAASFAFVRVPQHSNGFSSASVGAIFCHLIATGEMQGCGSIFAWSALPLVSLEDLLIEVPRPEYQEVMKKALGVA